LGGAGRINEPRSISIRVKLDKQRSLADVYGIALAQQPLAFAFDLLAVYQSAPAASEVFDPA